MASPALKTALKNFANKISGTTVVDNGNDPTSAAFKMKQSVGKPNPNDPMRKKQQFAAKFKPTITPSNGIGVGP